MDKTERELFGRALNEALSRKYERELAECQETAQCSEAHIQRMNEIIGQSARAERRKGRRKWIVALLVAAALLLTACTVYAYHEELRTFIERVHDSHIQVTYDHETDAPSADMLAENYMLSYVPDGYVLTGELYLSTLSRCAWENSEGEYIKFEQCVLDSTNFALDVMLGETTVISCENFDVYCRSSDTYTYIWNDGIYSFKIKSSVPLTEDVLICIIEGAQIVK